MPPSSRETGTALAGGGDRFAARNRRRGLPTVSRRWACPFAFASRTGSPDAIPTACCCARRRRAGRRRVLAAIDAALDLDRRGRNPLRRHPRRVGRALPYRNGRLRAVRLSGERRRPRRKGGCASGSWRRAGRADPPTAGRPRRRTTRGCATPAKVVCNCLDVTERAIAAALPGAPTLAALQAKLGCGTSCGSCVPELKRMLATREREAA